MQLSSRGFHTLANLEDVVQALQNTTPGITISAYIWMIPGDSEIVWEDGRSDFDALYVLAWRHPGTAVHYPIPISCPMGKSLKSLSID